MEFPGRVQNGVVVFDGPQTLLDGTEVIVRTTSTPVIRVNKIQRQVEFPLFPSSEPGSLHLTNEQIQEIFDEEDFESSKNAWNNPSQ